MVKAEHSDEGHHSGATEFAGRHFSQADSVEEIENADESDSDNGEFITIKVTNDAGQTATKEVDHIKEHKPR